MFINSLIFILIWTFLYLSEAAYNRKEQLINTQSKKGISKNISYNKNLKNHVILEGSGYTDDSEEDDDLSGNGSGENMENVFTKLKPCIQLLSAASKRRMVGDFVPRCTSLGDFAPIQCHGSTGECWCATSEGKKIYGTSVKEPHSPKCSKYQNREFKTTVLPLSKQRSTYRQVRPPKKIAKNLGIKHPVTKDMARGENVVRLDNTDYNVVVENIKPNEHIPYETINYKSSNILLEENVDISGYQFTISPLMAQPGILAGIIAGIVVGLICSIVLIMLFVNRMRKSWQHAHANKNVNNCNTLTHPYLGYSYNADHDFYA